MGVLPNLIYFSSIATTRLQIIAQYLDGDEALLSIAVKCLEQIPPFHSRFSYTTNMRMFGCIIESPFIYCAIIDEALRKSDAFSFLEQVRDEFKMYLRNGGLSIHDSRLEAHSADHDFDPIFRRLVVPFAGIPQKDKDPPDYHMQAPWENDVDFEEACASTTTTAYEDEEQSLNSEKGPGSRSPSTPLIGKASTHKKKKGKDQAKDSKDSRMDSKGKSADKVQKLEIVVEGSTSSASGSQMQKTGSMKYRSQQVARRMWWRNVKLILLLDVILCLILLAIWLGVCGGISCMQKRSTGS